MDKSFILDAIQILKDSENNQKYRTYAIIAPSISSQFQYAKLGQVIAGIKALGFHSVVEAALGADMVAYKEAAELPGEGVPHQLLLSRLCGLCGKVLPRTGGADLPDAVAYGDDRAVAQRKGSRLQGCVYRPLCGKEKEFQMGKTMGAGGLCPDL